MGYNAIPQHLRVEIDALNANQFLVGVTRTYTRDQLADGKLGALGVSVDGGQPAYQPAFLPPPTTRWGKWNVDGRMIVRRDLPRVDKEWSTTVPTWGNRGHHTIGHTREVYVRETRLGENMHLNIEHESLEDNRYVFRITADRVFPTSIALPDHEVHMAASLIKDFMGTAHALNANQTPADWSRTQAVDWEFLPPGQNTELPDFNVAAERLGVTPDNPRYNTLEERYQFFNQFQPTDILYGTSGFARYLAFRFEGVTVLENFHYGNAAYVMFEDWEQLSRRSRSDLLANAHNRYVRIVHTGNWRRKLQTQIERHTGRG